MLLSRLSRASLSVPSQSRTLDLLLNNLQPYLQPLSTSIDQNAKIHTSENSIAPGCTILFKSSRTVPSQPALSRPLSPHGSLPTQIKGSDHSYRQISSGAARAVVERPASGTFAWGGIFAIGTAALSTAGAALAKDPQPTEEVAAASSTIDEYTLPTTLKGALPKDILVYQYEVCPFCSKVKTFLDYHKLPYKSVEVNPLTKGELKWSTYKKVPVVVVDGEVVTDSSRIISHLEAEIRGLKQPSKEVKQASSWFSTPKPTTPSPSAGVSAEEEKEWRKWVDARLVKVMTANIYRNWDETRKSFAYITEHSQWGFVSRELAKTAGAILMWQVGGRMPKKYGIEGDLREALYAELNKFVDAIGSRDFLGGSAPNLADLAVFGVLRCISGTPTHNDMLAHSKIKPWYERMEVTVGESQETRLKELPPPPTR